MCWYHDALLAYKKLNVAKKTILQKSTKIFMQSAFWVRWELESVHFTGPEIINVGNSVFTIIVKTEWSKHNDIFEGHDLIFIIPYSDDGSFCVSWRSARITWELNMDNEEE